MSSNKCAIFDTDCPKLKSELQALIVFRNLKASECFVVNYTKYTQMVNNGNNTLQRTNLTMYYCIKDMTES